MYSDREFSYISEVSNFMQSLFTVDRDRYLEALDYGIPHGDGAYGAALADWLKSGKPDRAFFSYAPGQVECKLLIAFRKEISEKFGLEILTTEEGEERRRLASRVKTVKVTDWLLN